MGLGLADEAPHYATISRFRQQVTARGLAAALFAEVSRQLATHGLVVKAGTLLDATLVQAQARRPTGTAQPGAKSPTDPDAAWTGRGAKAHFGYKVHLGVDAGSGLIRAACLTPAQIAESTVADTLILGDEVAVYADRAYESKLRRQRLKAAGIKDRIMHRAHKYQARLPYWARPTQSPDRAGAGASGAGIRDAEAAVSLPAGALPGTGPQYDGAVVQVSCVQLATR